MQCHCRIWHGIGVAGGSHAWPCQRLTTCDATAVYGKVQLLQAAPMLGVANGLTACEATIEYNKVRVLHAAGLLCGSWRERQHGSCDGHCTRPISFLLHPDRGPPGPYTGNWAIAGLQSEESLAGEQCQCARPVALSACMQISAMGVLLKNTSVSVE